MILECHLEKQLQSPTRDKEEHVLGGEGNVSQRVEHESACCDRSRTSTNEDRVLGFGGTIGWGGFTSGTYGTYPLGALP